MVVLRDDLSDRLYHLTKDANAFDIFVQILNDQALIGGDGFIRGKHKCVCFSEAPISKLSQILATPHGDYKYRPYGFVFSKRWVYSQGGRPVIYQEQAAYDRMDPSKQHLHVRFELGESYSVDYTWEREWRIKTDRLQFTPDNVTVLMPTRLISDSLKEVWVSKNSGQIYPWHHIVLEDLGVAIPDYLPIKA